MEDRLDVIENKIGINRRLLMEERQQIAPTGNLGGKEIANENGTTVKTSIVGVCDSCGDKMGEQFVICHVDKKKICPGCAVVFDQRKICKECLKSNHPLSKQSYKVLVTIANKIDNRRTLHNLTKITKNDLVASIGFLREAAYIIRKGLTGYQITDSGMNIITAYRQVYGPEDDVVTLDRELRRHIGVL